MGTFRTAPWAGASRGHRVSSSNLKPSEYRVKTTRTGRGREKARERDTHTHTRKGLSLSLSNFSLPRESNPTSISGTSPQLWSRNSKCDGLAPLNFSGFHFPSPIRGYGLSSDFSRNFEAHARLAARVLRRPRPRPQDLKSIIWDQI